MDTLSASSIASLCLHGPKHFDVQLHQTEHRVALMSKWNIDWHNAKVLELGCGQGDCTAVLAEAVGVGGHITAVDPASLSYGEASLQIRLQHANLSYVTRITLHAGTGSRSFVLRQTCR